MPESLLSFSEVLIYGRELKDLEYKRIASGGQGDNKHLDKQFGVAKGAKGPRFAKIYGFAFEGTYYDMPEPVIFLVHGEGDLVADPNKPADDASRAPKEPGIGGVAAAAYQVADEIRVWKYDKSDQTMRMDVMTGQFEQVLLDIYFGDDSPAISGARVSGARVSGARVSGARVSGARVSGARVSGARARGTED